MDYAKIAKESRLKVLELVYRAQTSHIGSLFSCADIMAALFEKIDLDKDKFVLSAGWKAAMLYYHLWRKGRISEEELNSYCQLGSKFIGLAEPFCCPDIIAAGGSMGLAFSMAVGMARTRRLLNKPGKVWVLMSDGEMQCGNVWESARHVAHEKIPLVVFVDLNGFCAMGKITEILSIDTAAFFSGWLIINLNGHNFDEIVKAIEGARKSSKPVVIVAKTIKGQGVSFMEGCNEWHYRSVDQINYQQACYELVGQKKR